VKYKYRFAEYYDMSTIDSRTSEGETGDVEGAAETAARTGVQTYEVVDSMDATGRTTLRTSDGERLTVVGYVDELAGKRLRDRPTGATVRMELTPAPSGTGHLAARVLSGSLPAL